MSTLDTDSPLRDIHDPREHFRRLFGDTQTALVDHIRAIGSAAEAIHKPHNQAQHQEIAVEAHKVTQALAMFVATTISEANKIGVQEGREERDISEIVFRGALEALTGNNIFDPAARADAIRAGRALWDETRKHVLETQARARAKQQAETQALVDGFVQAVGAAAKPA